MTGAKPMSSNGEQVTNDAVDREESLRVCHRFEALLHIQRPSSRGPTADYSTRAAA